MAKLRRPIYEVPISYYGRTYEEGKKIQFKDAIYAFWYVIKYNRLVSLKKSFIRIPQFRNESALVLPYKDISTGRISEPAGS